MELQFVKGIGPKRQELLAEMGIQRPEDLLSHYPRRYEDRTRILKLNQLQINELSVVKVRLVSLEVKNIRPKLSLIKALIQDETGSAYAVWFNQTYLARSLRPGKTYLLTGRPKSHPWALELMVEDQEVAEGTALIPRILPIYPLVKGLNQRVLRQAVEAVLAQWEPEGVDEIATRFDLAPLKEAVRQIHFPESWAALEQARHRLVFDEFFYLQLTLGILKSRAQPEGAGIAHQGRPVLTNKWLSRLPFQLTKAQVRVIGEVEEDMKAPRSMRRLIQGDVGSGKTAIAAWALLKAVENGGQGAMMAPTEILARQHYQTLKTWFESLGVVVVCLVSGMKASERKTILEALKEGRVHVVVGTHALIQSDVAFKQLSLYIIDEQHRFGVRQRALLEEKGETPDLLVMSATPIPRTLALTIYGDLDLSLLDELPPGRKTVETLCLLEKARPKVYQFIKNQLVQGAQAYVICPLVEESEDMDLKDAERVFETLQKVFSRYRVGLVHGRLKPKDKESVMAGFKEGRIHILVSTTVVEVGVDVPNASVMVIENAERFGLAQLHQLRGRVGRGQSQAHCFLMTHTDSPLALKRLKLMTLSNDGFYLAEQDMLLRGPGEMAGTRQHGLPEFKLAQLPKDIEVLEKARAAALRLLSEDPSLKSLPQVRQTVKARLGEIAYS